MKKLFLLLALASILFSCSTDDNSGCTKFASYTQKVINGKYHFYVICEDGYTFEIPANSLNGYPIGGEYCH